MNENETLIDLEELNDLIPELGEAKAELKDAKAKESELVADVKNAFTYAFKGADAQIEIDDKYEVEIGDYKATLTGQDKSTMNQEKLMERLQELGHDHCIKHVPQVDQAEVERMIYEGELDMKELEDCVVPKCTVVLKVTKKKVKKVKGVKI